MTIGINIKYHLLEAKKQVLAIPSEWPYLQAGCSDTLPDEELIVRHWF